MSDDVVVIKTDEIVRQAYEQSALEKTVEDRVLATHQFARFIGSEPPPETVPDQRTAWYLQTSAMRKRAANEALDVLAINSEAEVARMRDALRLKRSGQDVPLSTPPPRYLTNEEIGKWFEKQQEILRLAQLQERIEILKMPQVVSA